MPQFKLPFFIGGIAVLLIVAGLLLEKSHASNSEQSVLPSTAPVNPPSSITDFKTVGTAGYSLNVPEVWQEVEHSSNFPNETIFQSSGGLYTASANLLPNINKTSGLPYTSLDEFIGMPYQVKKLIVMGQDARQPLPRAGSENVFRVYFFTPDRQSIVSLELQIGTSSITDPRLNQTTIQEGEVLFNQMLSSFRFVGQGSQGETSSMKTYANTAYNISFQYPGNWMGPFRVSGTMRQGEETFQGSEGTIVTSWGGGFGGGPCHSAVVVLPSLAGKIGFCATLNSDGTETLRTANEGPTPSNLSPLSILATVNAPLSQNEPTVKQILYSFQLSPSPTCVPRPSCLDVPPRCMIAEPLNGWCK